MRLGHDAYETAVPPRQLSITVDIMVAFTLYPSLICSNCSSCLTVWCRARGTWRGYPCCHGCVALAPQHPCPDGVAASVCLSVCLQFPT